MGYVNLLYGGFKKVIKRLLYFIVPPQSVFMKMFFLTPFTQNCLSLSEKVFSLF